jgi:TRAP-type C4-dicarboxylate transport system permease small subunit
LWEGSRAWRKNSLMAIEVVTDRLPARLQSALRMLNYALICAFLIYLIVWGGYLSWTSRIRSFQGIPGVSYSWITMSLPVGAALMLLTTARKVLAEMRGEHAVNQAVDVM